MKAQTIRNFSIPEIKRTLNSGDFGDDLVVFSGRKYPAGLYQKPASIDAVAISLCTEGEADVTIAGKKHRMTGGTIAVKTPGTCNSYERVSLDYKGFEFIVSMEFLKALPFDMKNLVLVFTYTKHQACFSLSEKQTQDYIRMFELAEGLSQNLDFYKTQSLQGVVISLLYSLCELFQQTKKESDQSAVLNGDRKHYYLLSFMELLAKHSVRERSVGFYADKLCITPKYFSWIVKEVSGKSAAEWINEYVMMEAKALLQHTETNIAETAYQLNFPNASFFGRYFKKHTGMSPGDFKKRMAFQ